MNDFTLVIPTFNRPRELTALLRHLSMHPIVHDWKILVLDSTQHPHDVYAFTQDGLNMKMVHYHHETHPFDKFRQGLGHVTTKYCALCADDDLYIPSAIEQCVQVMRENQRATMAVGWSFAYDEQLKLVDTVRKNVSIMDTEPFMRLAKLFAHYHALTYGVYRTAELQQIMTKASALPTILTRELLASSMAAIEGEIIYVPQFAHGRCAGQPVQPYVNCHPMQWVLNDADGMFAEYVKFRDILSREVAAANSRLDEPTIKRGLNLMFIKYLRQTCNVAYFVDNWSNIMSARDQITIAFEDSRDEGAPVFELEPWERHELEQAMLHYKLED